MLRHVGHAHSLQGFVDDDPILRAKGSQRRKPGCAPQLDHIAHRQRLGGFCNLFHDCNILGDVPSAEAGQGLAIQQHGAGRSRQKPGQKAQQGGFARAVRTDQAECFARRHLERDILNNAPRAGCPAKRTCFKLHIRLRLRTRIIAKPGAPTSAVTTPIGTT